MSKPLKTVQKLLLATFAIITIVSCSTNEKQYRIGVSQCSDDIWRDKQNAELRMGAYFHENVELKFAAAYDSDERQIQQIDSLVNSGIDLLIVAPNQVSTISTAIDRAYDKGIPVIVFERKTNSQKYTAFISADNYEMGRQMGKYIASRLKGKGRVMEVMGLEGSSPAIERHKGFKEALNGYPNIVVAATLQGDWTEPTAYSTVKKWRDANPSESIDLVFGMNDRTAMGARKAFEESGGKLPLFCGIDGLPGENGGIRLVRDSLLDASYIYPTHGDKIIQLAINILDGKPYKKEQLLMSALVTHDNADVLLLENDEIMRQSSYLDQLHEKADGYLQALGTQRIINWLAISTILLLVVVFVLFYLYHRRKIALQRERVLNTLWNLKSEEVLTAEKPSKTTDNAESTKSDGPSVFSEENKLMGVSLFITRFKEVVEARLNDSDFSVEDLATDMNLSRVQLYRKVKAVTGSSPVEMLRTARLNRAYQLLLTTDKSVSEVAYAVGFTSPSYFTKCFKDEYGIVPGEARNVK
ncbi:MAG: substrate-binding domain-containing protein [Prevotella sp.]|nr:substrate-binding domain-containing protein [Prevotella sp.]